jgi:hypothetical protein
MIYLFAGDDVEKKRKIYEKFIDSSVKDVDSFFINKNDFSIEQVENFFKSQGLFFKKSIVFFENLFFSEEIENFLLSKLDLMESSKNDFVFLEGKLNKKTIDIFKKNRAELNIFELSPDKKEKFNNFLLADALMDRDKLKMWIYFNQALEKNVALEELVGVLFWKAKDMILKKNFRKFSLEELKNFCAKISYLLPEARKKGLDDKSVFEQFILESF